jgi:hypothetical protein
VGAGERPARRRADPRLRAPPTVRYRFLRGTGPARAGGARCIIEAETTRETHHVRSAGSLVALPVERDDPPAAVAAASLVPRRRRRSPSSLTERVHSGTASRATVSVSIPRPLRSSEASMSNDHDWPAAPLIDFSRTSSSFLHPGISRVAELSVRRPTEGDQIRTQDPAPGGELAGWGFSRGVGWWVLSQC